MKADRIRDEYRPKRLTGADITTVIRLRRKCGSDQKVVIRNGWPEIVNKQWWDYLFERFERWVRG